MKNSLHFARHAEAARAVDVTGPATRRKPSGPIRPGSDARAGTPRAA